MINLNHDNYLLQDAILHRKRSGSCLFAIETLPLKNVNSEEGKDRVFQSGHCMF